MSSAEESLAVVFHAAQLGRSDVILEAISSLKTTLGSDEKVAAMISTCMEYQVDDNTKETATPLHVATSHGFSDVVRTLLVIVNITAISMHYHTLIYIPVIFFSILER
jgi:hypothetical protein